MSENNSIENKKKAQAEKKSHAVKVSKKSKNLGSDHSSLSKLQDECGKLSGEIKKLKESMLRKEAEKENIKKRSSKEIAENKKYAIFNFSKELLEIMENIIRALDSTPNALLKQNEPLNTLYQGLDITKISLEAIFNKYNIKRIHPLNEKFDHNFHQVISQKVDNSIESGSIVEVIQAGYILNGRLLRPALVVVAKHE